MLNGDMILLATQDPYSTIGWLLFGCCSNKWSSLPTHPYLPSGTQTIKRGYKIKKDKILKNKFNHGGEQPVF